MLDHGNHDHNSRHASVDELDLRTSSKRKGFLAPHNIAAPVAKVTWRRGIVPSGLLGLILVLVAGARRSEADADFPVAGIRSSIAAGKLGEALLGVQHLVNRLSERFELQIVSAFPPPPAGWSSVSTEGTPPTRTTNKEIEFDLGIHYTSEDGQWIELRVLRPQIERAEELRIWVEDASASERFMVNSYVGRWTQVGADGPTLVLLLMPRGEIVCSLRTSSGSQRGVVNLLLTADNLTRLFAGSCILGDRTDRPSTARAGVPVEDMLSRLETWFSEPSGAVSVPLRWARSLLKALARRRIDAAIQALGLPSGWTLEEEPTYSACTARRTFAISASFRNRESLLAIKIYEGGFDSRPEETAADSSKWGPWIPVKLLGAAGRRRVFLDGHAVETEVRLAGSGSGIVMTNSGVRAALESARVTTVMDFQGFWRWLQAH